MFCCGSSEDLWVWSLASGIAGVEPQIELELEGVMSGLEPSYLLLL